MAGELFIQPVVDGQRMDGWLGGGPWLITKSAAATTIEQFVIGSTDLGPFSEPLAAWLDERDAEAVLVRPDRYIFGIGASLDLMAAWESMMAFRTRTTSVTT